MGLKRAAAARKNTTKKKKDVSNLSIENSNINEMILSSSNDPNQQVD